MFSVIRSPFSQEIYHDFIFRTSVFNIFQSSHVRLPPLRGIWNRKGGSVESKRRQRERDLVVPGLTPLLRLEIANWSASCQLGFLTCSIYFSTLFHSP